MSNNAKKLRVVVTLSTLPGRLEIEAILPTLKSLHNQTRKPDAIYLSLPKFAKRINKNYPEPSAEIKKLCTIVEIEEDYGPVTKLLGGLYSENSPNTLIISVDDDFEYSSTLIENHIKNHLKNPDSAIGSSGSIIGRFPGYLSYIRNNEGERYKHWYGKIPTKEQEQNGIDVDLLYGFSSILYVRKMFPMNKQELVNDFLKAPLENKSLFTHDDIYISCYLNSRNVARKIHVMDDVKQVSIKNNDSLSSETISFYTKFVKAVAECKKRGLIKSQVEVNCSETLTGKYFIWFIIILIIFIILFVLISSKMKKSK